ncbi:hypothetical protein JL722_12661 [Aureococcus anophagefferens]|nr:hypothetical protein JL722_12661 [Aureococcus anophagefferens]
MPEAQQSYGVLDYGHFDYGDFFDEPLVPNDGWGLLCTANEELICSAPTPNLFSEPRRRRRRPVGPGASGGADGRRRRRRARVDQRGQRHPRRQRHRVRRQRHVGGALRRRPARRRRRRRYVALALAIDPIAVSNVTCAVVPGRRLDDAAPRRCAGAVERYSVVVVVRDLVSADAADDAAGLYEQRLVESFADDELDTICDVSATVLATRAARPAAGDPGDLGGAGARADARADGDAREPHGSARARADAGADVASELGSRTWADAAAVAGADGRRRASAAPTACDDSGAWHKNGAPSKDCDWVRSHPPRCAAVGWDGAVAAAACRGACGCSRPPTARRRRGALLVRLRRPERRHGHGLRRRVRRRVGQRPRDLRLVGLEPDDGARDAARFLGALHGFALDDVAPALAGAGPRTLGAWLRIDAFDGGYALEIGGGAAACENFGLRAGWSEALELAFKGDCAVSVADAGLAAGRWHHVAVAYDGAAAWTLVDGGVAASGTAVLDTAGAAPLVVGGTTASPLTGAVDDLFAYGAALDADAVRALRDRGGRTYAPTAAPAPSPTAATRPPSPAPTARGTPAPSVEHCAHGRGLDFAEFVVDDEIGSPSFTWGVDLDQDGDMDVLTTSLHDNTVAWSENDGNQSFTERLLTSTAMSAAFASYGDVNEDGAFDVLAVSWGDNTTRLFVNDGAMSFFEVQLDSEEAPTDVVVFDFDGDGDTDVLAASWYKGTIFWFEGHGELATYYAKAYIAEGARRPLERLPRGHRLRRGPRRPRGDGLRLRGDVVRENDGNMTFAVRVVDTEVIQPREVVARDGDGDGDVDLFVAVRGASELVWYEDDGRQNWEKIVIADDAYGAYTICPTDLDGDGDIDVVGASKEKDEIPWYENDGAMGFGEHMVSTTAVGVRYSIVADMDSDADLDVVAALAGRDCTVWYENGCENQDYAPATSLLALGLEASSAPDSLMTIIAEAEGYDDDVD